MPASTSRFVAQRSTAGLARRCGSARGGQAASLETLEQRALLSFSWTPQEVYLSELVNRARANPQAEATRLGIDLAAGLTSAEAARLVPQEPLALNRFLTSAARAHSLDMATRNFFDHTNPSGQSPTDRARAAGYGGTAGENIAGGYTTIDAAHRGWMQSVGHRKNVLSLHSNFDASFHYDEFGPGFALSAGGAYNHYYTEMFGYQGASPAIYLLGVVFNDADNNDFYGIGEGLAGVRIDVALQSAPSTVVGTYTTDAAGNYQIALSAGAYNVTFTRLSDGYRVSRTATIGSQNVKLDAKAAQFVNPNPVIPDDFANQGQWTTAGSIDIDPATGNGVKVGVFETAGDTDLFRFVASRTGVTTITLAHPAGLFATSLLAYNGSRALVATGAPGGETGNGSVVNVQVTAGQTYYLLARPAVSTSIGSYLILIQGPTQTTPPPDPTPTPGDDFANIGQFSSAGVISLDGGTGHATRVGYLEFAGDTDLFRFVTTRPGQTTITLWHPEGALGLQLRLFNSAGEQIQAGEAGTEHGNGSVLTLTAEAGETFYISAEASDGVSVGVYQFLFDGPGAEPPPPRVPVINDGVVPARESLVATMRINNRLTLVFMNGWNQPIMATLNDDGSWSWADIRGSAGTPAVDGEIVTWSDRREGLTYMAMRSADGLVLFREHQPGQWSVRNLSDEIDTALFISSDLSTIVDPMGRVSIVGVSDTGELVAYMQTLQRNTSGEYRWTFRNITAKDIDISGNSMPYVASELVTWTTRAGSCNIAFLDDLGNIQLVYKAKGKARWSIQDLSNVARTGSPLVGELTVVQTPRNGGVHIAGTDERGRVWVTSYRENLGWTVRNLTQRLRGYTLDVRSLTSYVAKSGFAFIAGIKSDGTISMYRYNAAKHAWAKVDLGLNPPDFRNMRGRLDSVVDTDTGEINIVGTLDSTRLVRWTWTASGGWVYQDVSYKLAETAP